MCSWDVDRQFLEFVGSAVSLPARRPPATLQKLQFNRMSSATSDSIRNLNSAITCTMFPRDPTKQLGLGLLSAAVLHIYVLLPTSTNPLIQAAAYFIAFAFVILPSYTLKLHQKWRTTKQFSVTEPLHIYTKYTKISSRPSRGWLQMA